MAVTLQDTPSSNRVHIGIFGRRNAGKSSLLNAFTGQQISIVSDLPGTTTDPVQKPMELHGIGPCVFWDTAGYDDIGQLGQERISRTELTACKVDVALLVMDGEKTIAAFKDREAFALEKYWIKQLYDQNTPIIYVINKSDLLSKEDAAELKRKMLQTFQAEDNLIFVSAKEREGFTELHNMLLRALPESFFQESILHNLIQEGDLVLLVMPQDIQAPKGRLILPQVQTIRELLDKKCCVMSCTTDKIKKTLECLSKAPKLIITDSQVFQQVYQEKPADSLLTSFSILFAAYKGDIRYYMESAAKLDSLQSDSKVLIAECCTHAPLAEDIGREKIPRLLKKRYGEALTIEIVSGTDFPEDLSGYDMVIQCGGCMFNRKYVLSRIERARRQQIPMSNYGIVLAYMAGILDQVVIP